VTPTPEVTVTDTVTPTSTPVDVPVLPGAGGPGGTLPFTLIAALLALAGLLLWARRSPG
jgi:MYXO-CTERM domain-containing protein